MGVIIRGGEGAKKEAVIQSTLKKMLCVEGGELTCNCQSCRYDLRYHPDILMINPIESESGNSRSLKKEQADEAQSFLSEYPAIGKTRVCVVNDAHMATEAFSNAILKSVEEGPGEWVFSTQKRLIDTIESRCSVENVFPVSEATDIEGLSRSAVYAATGLNPEIIGRFTGDGFMKYLASLLKFCEEIQKKREWIEFFHSLNEKDPESFFEQTKAEAGKFSAVMRLLSGIFFEAVTGGLCLSSYSALKALYSKERLFELSQICEGEVVRREGNYTKNDFFLFLAELIE